MKTKKNTIRLTESELKKVIAESVKRVLKESQAEPIDYILQGCRNFTDSYYKACNLPNYNTLVKFGDELNDIMDRIEDLRMKISESGYCEK
jgi:hypothetical protein